MGRQWNKSFITQMTGFVFKETAVLRRWKMRQENLVSNDLIKLILPQKIQYKSWRLDPHRFVKRKATKGKCSKLQLRNLPMVIILLLSTRLIPNFRIHSTSHTQFVPCPVFLRCPLNLHLIHFHLLSSCRPMKYHPKIGKAHACRVS